MPPLPVCGAMLSLVLVALMEPISGAGATPVAAMLDAMGAIAAPRNAIGIVGMGALGPRAVPGMGVFAATAPGCGAPAIVPIIVGLLSPCKVRSN